MRYPLDTHVLIWALDAPARLPPVVGALMRGTSNYPFGVAAIAPWEITLLATRGRLQLNRPEADWINEALHPDFVELLPLTPPIAVDNCALPGIFHPDPADRIIVASGRHHGLTILTADDAIRAYPHL